MASKFRTAVLLLTANAVCMNQALSAPSETLRNSPITERQHCTVHKKSTNTELDATCGYKIDERGQRVKYREFYDDNIDRVIQQYQIAPAVFDSQGKKVKDARWDEVVIKLETAPAAPGMSTDEVRAAAERETREQQKQAGRFNSPQVALFPRPDREDETDKGIMTATNILIVSGAVIGIIGLGYGYKMIRRSGKRAGAVPQVAPKILKQIDSAPKAVHFANGTPFGKKRVAIRGHVPGSAIPRGARRYSTQEGRDVVIYQDPISNQLLAYMVWDDMLLSHPIHYGEPISLSGSGARPIMNDGSGVSVRLSEDTSFAQPAAADIARPSAGAPGDFVVAGRVESEQVVSSRQSDYSNDTPISPAPAPRESSLGSSTSEPAPAPRDWMDTPPSPPAESSSNAPAPAPPYEAPAPAPPSDYS